MVSGSASRRLKRRERRRHVLRLPLDPGQRQRVFLVGLVLRQAFEYVFRFCLLPLQEEAGSILTLRFGAPLDQGQAHLEVMNCAGAIPFPEVERAQHGVSSWIVRPLIKNPLQQGHRGGSMGLVVHLRGCFECQQRPGAQAKCAFDTLAPFAFLSFATEATPLSVKAAQSFGCSVRILSASATASAL